MQNGWKCFQIDARIIQTLDNFCTWGKNYYICPMHKSIKIVTLSLSVVLFSWSLGAAPSYLFRRHTASGGLSSNTVRAMIQSRSGLIWMGTSDGLDSFDGSSYRHYTFSDDALSNYVNAICESSDGTIWVGTDNSIFRQRDGAFVPLDVPGAPTVIITEIAEDADGSMWFATRTEGVYHLRGDSMTRYDVGGNDYAKIFADSFGTLWSFVSGDNLLYIFDRENKKFVPASLKYSGCEPSRVSAMIQDSSGAIWAGTWSDGIRRIDPNTREVTSYGGGKGFQHLHSVTETAPWTFLVGSDDGLLWFNALTGEKQLYINDKSSPLSLSDKFVYPVIQDFEGGIWVGTYYGGVNYASPTVSRFDTWSMSALTGATENYTVSSFCEGEDGSIWVGSDNGGLMHLDPYARKSLGAWPTMNVQTLLSSGGKVWVGTYTENLKCLDVKTGKVREYLLRDASLYSLFQDSGGTLWAATMTTIERYDRSTDSFIMEYAPGDAVVDIEEGEDGSLWFATSGHGLFRRLPTGVYRNYTVSDGLVSNKINCLGRFSDGSLYVGSAKGLDILAPGQARFSRVDFGEDTNVMFIARDGTRLWLSTGKGLIAFTPSEGRKEFYNSNDGIFTDWFVTGSGFVASDGRIFVGATDGFVSFYPRRIKANAYVPPVVVSEEVTGDRSRTFHFAALSYCAPEKNRYAYRLEGLEDEWHEAIGRNSAEYGPLSPGKYRFVVRGSNNDGLWNTDGASVSFVINPHPLLSPVAIVIYLVLFGILVYLLIRKLVRDSEKRYRKRYEEILSEREKLDLDAKVRFVTSIAHEIRTPLSLISAPMERLRSRTEGEVDDRTRADMDVIDKSSRRLMTLVNQILDFSDTSKASLASGAVRYGNISASVASVADSFIPTLEKNGITLRRQIESGLEGDLDEEALYKMVSNLLSNASKYTDDTISISLSREEGEYLVTVTDNGRGIPSGETERIFDPFYRLDESKLGTGLGLPIVRQIAESFGGAVTAGNSPGGGAVFTLRMPLTDKMKGVVEDIPEEPSTPLGIPLSAALPAKNLPVLLIVEDDEDMREFLVREFSGEYEVIEAEDGEKARAMLRLNEVSIVISDWMMPRLSGVELCQWMRSQSALCHIPFIMLTARTDDESALRSVSSGADAHVRKPFSLAHLHALADHQLKMRDILAKKYSGQSPIGQSAPQDDQDSFITRLNGIIESNIANSDLSVDTLASEMCVSRSGLFSKVKGATGMTPNALIINARLKAAANLLEGGKHSVNEVCYMVGFNSPSYFSKSFFRRYGLTPHQWMEQKGGQ